MTRLVHPATLLGMVLVAMVLLSVAVIVVFAIPVAVTEQAAMPTVVMQIVPAATLTPVPPTPSRTPEPSPTLPLPPSPQPGEIGIGAYVQVNGTGSAGLRVRSEPGLQATTRFVAIEAEVFQVIEGPQEMDGYTWWHLLSPSNEQAQGWAVANYLVAIERP